MTNRLNKVLLASASPALMLLASVVIANAQSTATSEMETVVSTGMNSAVNGIMRPITVPKQRSTIDTNYLVTQTAGQTVMESLNKVPGFNFTNNDPYGSSGGNIRIHGFDGNHISLTLDGMPLNDTGNYAVYTNQLMDPENIGQISVNQGATDVDSPSAAASGGVVAIRTSRPSDSFAIMLQPSAGSFNYQRYFGRIDTGAFGPWNTLAFASVSMASNDKWKGPGKIQKRQFNVGFYQDMGDLGFVTLGAHWNRNRNNNYASLSFLPVGPSAFVSAGLGGTYTVARPNALLDPNTGEIFGALGVTTRFGNSAGFGLETDYDATCARISGDAAGATATANSDTLCANYYSRQINPSDTGNVRLSSLWRLSDDVTFTLDPSINYTLANGGSQYTQLNERDPRLIGTSTASGVDLNGDSNFGAMTGAELGRASDVTGVFGPSNTNTVRYGINTSLLWTMTDEHAIQLAYTLDYGIHKQTGQAAYLKPDGSPYDWFGGYDDAAHRVLAADGSTYRTRDRKSHAILNQGAFTYEGDFLDKKLHASIGARLPFLTRDLNQYCYLQVVTGTTAPNNSVGQPGVGFPFCTTAAPTSVNATNNTVTLAGMGNALFTAPASTSVTYTRFLPNVGLSYKVTDEIMVYGAWAASLSAPRTDNLYNGGNNGLCAIAGVGVSLTSANQTGCRFSSFNTSVKLETSNNYAVGIRYNTDLLNLTLDAYNNQFKNRIVSTYDPEQGISLDRSIGNVNVNGVDFEAGLFPFEGFSSYSSASYYHSRVSDTPAARICANAACAATTVINLVGKEQAESPNWTLSQRFQYKIAGFNLGLGGKYTGRRYADDRNDIRMPTYVVVDADISYDLGQIGWAGSFIKFNASNLFDEKYLGSISSQRCFSPTGGTGCTSYPFAYAGSPQTFSVTLRSVF